MKKLGVAFILIGISLISVFGYQYWLSIQSVSTIEEDNVVKNNNHQHFTNENATKLINIDEAKTPNYENGDEVAKLVMPSIDLTFDVFWGTGEEALSQGVGMYVSDWTTPPDLGGHTVLSGHRDTVFKPVGELNDGDSIYVSYQGEDYEYEINKIWITDEDDDSVIVEKNEPTLTLSTCYPFQFIGSAPERYIVQAKLKNKGDLLND